MLMFPVFTGYTVFRYEYPGSVIPKEYKVSEDAKLEHYVI